MQVIYFICGCDLLQALVAVNSRRKMYSVLRGPFSEDGIAEYVRELVGGRGRTTPLKGDIPPIADTEPWDGKDGQVSDPASCCSCPASLAI